MVNVDDFVKIVLAVSISFAIFGISIQIIRLLGRSVDVIGDLKRVTKNLADLSDFLNEDYQKGRKVFDDILNLVTNVKGKMESLLLFSSIGDKLIKKFKKDDTDEK